MALGSTNNTTVGLRVKAKNSNITRGKVIEEMLILAEVPLIRVFEENPYYTIVCTKKEAAKIMKKDTSEKLKKNGLEIQVPPELKVKRSIFMRQLDKHIGQHTAEEMEREILKNQDWIRTIIVTKDKRVYTCSKN